MLKFKGEFNHAFIISYERQPKLYKKLLVMNPFLLILIYILQFSTNQQLLIFILYNIISYLIGGNEVITEELQILKNIGIQIVKKKNNGKITKEFINQNIIKDVIIQEGLTTLTVEVYLAIICKGRKNMILPFQYNLTQEEKMQIYYPLRQMII